GWEILAALGIADKIRIEVNSLGDRDSRKAYRDALAAYLSRYKQDLSEDSKLRLEKNPLRILDSKDEGDRRIVADAPRMEACFTPAARSYYDRLLETLALLNIAVHPNPKLVRGLDYYSHTVF